MSTAVEHGAWKPATLHVVPAHAWTEIAPGVRILVDAGHDVGMSVQTFTAVAGCSPDCVHADRGVGILPDPPCPRPAYPDAWPYNREGPAPNVSPERFCLWCRELAAGRFEARGRAANDEASR